MNISLGKLILPLSFSLAALSMNADAGSWQNNASVGGFNKVHIYTPDSVSSIGQGKGLLIVLHGCTQSIDAFKTAKLETAAETYGLVIAVPDAMNKSGFSCWHYWDNTKSRSHKDYKNLISLATTLSSDANRNIDSKQVYIAGLSSGAAFANTTACLAPDVFAGMGISAGPSIGTSSSGAISTCESANVTSRCNTYAGSYASHFATQITSIAHGDADTTVNTCYNQQNASGMAGVYGVNQLSGSQVISEGTRTADQTLWTDGRVSMLWLNGLDHAWSGGAGASGSYIGSASINYASYLGEFFKNNNKRVSRNQAPTLSNVITSSSQDWILVDGDAEDAETSVSAINIEFKRLDSTANAINRHTQVDGSGHFSVNQSGFSNGLYSVSVTATDTEGATSIMTQKTQRVGPEPAAAAPTLQNITAQVSGQCATVAGDVFDINNNLTHVQVSFSQQTLSAAINGTNFSAQTCALAGGAQTATVTATDSSGLSTQASISFTIDAGSTGDYNHHINLGHITWGNGYSACYLAFGTNPFTMRETSAGSSQCQWVADGQASCAGPAQTCSNTPTDTDGDGIADEVDNCPLIANANQQDNDADGLGNACDSTPNGEQQPTDTDNDGVADSQDNCPNIANSNQLDSDADGVGDACDSTPNGDFQCTQTTSSNYAHVQGNRATTSGGYVYAKGSGTNIGLYNIFVTKTLAQTSSGFYILGNCPN
ncbi:PHB depolymerase family esterase [Simiduia litorea]|uniref:extracellular catalytic domain type 1 short-chain-length polyhydroxyalkanoate depolymerase n=1 Tax=Simiduia litorea TaxID=1435348 RepID=UPI0036F2EA3E